jgi:uncharacterized protein YdeI (YjbR/CyaY-like superfamily)
MNGKLFEAAAAWRAWLEKNHDKKKELWLVYYKKSSGRTSVTYEEALQEALCYGWIDSTVNKLDAERFMQRWTPRKPQSVWSASNKTRVKKLIAEGRMAAPGLAKIKLARKNRSWKTLDKIDLREEVPRELRNALAAVPGLLKKFGALPPFLKKQFSWWVDSAKRPETRARRVATALKMIEKGRRFEIGGIPKDL